MNKLITLLTVLLTVALAVPIAWAGERPTRTDQQISHQDMSPAVFFGYADQDQTADSARESMDRVADEKGTDVLKDAEARHDDLSNAEFFGYINNNTPTEKAVADMKNPVKMLADCPCGRTTDSINSRLIYDNLSPAAFFYDIPLPDAKGSRCVTC